MIDAIISRKTFKKIYPKPTLDEFYAALPESEKKRLNREVLEAYFSDPDWHKKLCEIQQEVTNGKCLE